MALLKNNFFRLYVALYCLSLTYLGLTGALPIEEGLTMLIIMGIGFSLIAYVCTIKAKPLPIRSTASKADIKLVLLMLCIIALFLSFGRNGADQFFQFLYGTSTAAVSLGEITWKIILFVALPFFVLKKASDYSSSDFGLSKNWKAVLSPSHLSALIVISLLFILFQYFMGNKATGFKDGAFSEDALFIGLLFSFLWLYIEVGLVEEFFFRGIVQGRFAAFYNNEISGVFAAALLFGLAHAPGLYLRGANSLTLGTDPTLFTAIAYSIVMLSVTGLFFGVIWARTRNLWILMGIHASADLLTNYQELRDSFGSLWL